MTYACHFAHIYGQNDICMSFCPPSKYVILPDTEVGGNIYLSQHQDFRYVLDT